ncbi:MAG: dicarboxylate/amino acid:cation symporter [Gemmatimonadales bacterium]
MLVGLAAGALLGIASRGGPPLLETLVRVAEPLGALFVNAIRLTVVPLVIALLVSGIGGVTDGGLVARLGGRSLGVGLALASVLAVFTALLAWPLLAAIPIDPVATAALRASSEAPVTPPGLARWLVDLVPANIVKAAADGGMLPLILFSVALGLATTRIGPARRAAVTEFFGGLADAMMVLVGWIIAAAPLGVFGLAAPLGATLGGSLAGALGGYVALAVGLTVLALALVLYPATVVLARTPLRQFVRAVLPAQAVALSSRSTMATLPAMIEAAGRLGVPGHAAGFVVPLAAATLRVGSAVGQTVAVLFAARLFDVSLSPWQLVTVLLTTVFTTFTTPGVPGGSIVVMVPILAAAGVPASAVGILLGVDVIPDMIRTTANVTGGIAAAVIVAGDRSPGSAAPPNVRR